MCEYFLSLESSCAVNSLPLYLSGDGVGSRLGAAEQVRAFIVHVASTISRFLLSQGRSTTEGAYSGCQKKTLNPCFYRKTYQLYHKIKHISRPLENTAIF